MILQVNNTSMFNLSMRLNINYELRYIEVTVSLWNKAKHTTQTKTFPAAEFDKAIDYYNQQEKMFV